MAPPNEVETALCAATALARERIRAKKAEALARGREEFIERQLARKRLSAKTGKSEDELLAEEVQAGKRRVLAQAARIRRNGRRFVAQSAMVTRARVRASILHRHPTRQGTSREHRSTVRRAGGAVRSRDRPRQSDDDDPDDHHVARPPLPRAQRTFLKGDVPGRAA
jgi:hypothetical protein